MNIQRWGLVVPVYFISEISYGGQKEHEQTSIRFQNNLINKMNNLESTCWSRIQTTP